MGKEGNERENESEDADGDWCCRRSSLVSPQQIDGGDDDDGGAQPTQLVIISSHSFSYPFNVVAYSSQRSNHGPVWPTYFLLFNFSLNEVDK
ncbi:hypothetical protein TSUD_269490 [Trifolium subterraneum]|uniref:Uncharacterized protein n=1 Tax=Trifolium subterraneum TaxID=3900 RepID=A0A2Z6MZK6_TRISU|nr:hypothetical protein TSUD_269490 [Trifolium subterraneum]